MRHPLSRFGETEERDLYLAQFIVIPVSCTSVYIYMQGTSYSILLETWFFSDENGKVISLIMTLIMTFPAIFARCSRKRILSHYDSLFTRVKLVFSTNEKIIRIILKHAKLWISGETCSRNKYDIFIHTDKTGSYIRASKMPLSNNGSISTRYQRIKRAWNGCRTDTTCYFIRLILPVI